MAVIRSDGVRPLAPWAGAAVKVNGMPELRWCANNSTKYPTVSKGRSILAADAGGGCGGGGGGGDVKVPRDECWTLISTPEFGQRHKVPQENVPPAKAKEVTILMLRAFGKLLMKIGPAGSSLCGGDADWVASRCMHTRVQLWGAAVPLNSLVNMDGLGKEFAFDAEACTGVCGDWLGGSSRGPKGSAGGAAAAGIGLEAAAVSGYALAEHLATHAKAYYADIAKAATMDVGLHGKFAPPAAGHGGVGSFPKGRRVGQPGWQQKHEHSHADLSVPSSEVLGQTSGQTSGEPPPAPPTPHTAANTAASTAANTATVQGPGSGDTEISSGTTVGRVAEHEKAHDKHTNKPDDAAYEQQYQLHLDHLQHQKETRKKATQASRNKQNQRPKRQQHQHQQHQKHQQHQRGNAKPTGNTKQHGATAITNTSKISKTHNESKVSPPVSGASSASASDGVKPKPKATAKAKKTRQGAKLNGTKNSPVAQPEKWSKQALDVRL